MERSPLHIWRVSVCGSISTELKLNFYLYVTWKGFEIVQRNFVEIIDHEYTCHEIFFFFSYQTAFLLVSKNLVSVALMLFFSYNTKNWIYFNLDDLVKYLTYFCFSLHISLVHNVWVALNKMYFLSYQEKFHMLLGCIIFHDKPVLFLWSSYSFIFDFDLS